MDSLTPRTPPAYLVTSVDHALRLAVALQLEGVLTVAGAAERLQVARSTAHRLLQMLVYRDFATQDEDRAYHPGPVLELAAHSPSDTARLRGAAVPHLQRLSEQLQESVNVSVVSGETTRFIASVVCHRSLQVTSREGMVFPLLRTTTGMLHLAELPDALAASAAGSDGELLEQVRQTRRQGFAVNPGRSERGLVAVAVPVRAADGLLLAGLSVSMPSVRYEARRLAATVAVLRSTADRLEADLEADLDTDRTADR